MVTKGIVLELVNTYQAKVRMPIFNGVETSKDGTPDNRLSIATICTLPNCNNSVQPGDIVFVAFEDNDISKPIIIGHLYKEKANNTTADIILNTLLVQSGVTLPESTTIGEVNSKEISYLHGLVGNIQKQLNYLQSQIDELRGE